MAEDIVKLLRSGSSITPVFWLHAPISNSKGRGSKIHGAGVGKIRDFRLKHRYLRTIRDSPMIAMEH